MQDIDIGCVLLDVGGTLWPERWPQPENDDTTRAAGVRAILPALSLAQARQVVQRLHAAAAAVEHLATQNTGGLIRDALRDHGLPIAAVEPEAVRRAMCLPARDRIELFAGARELLQTVRARGLACVVITNAVWRTGADYNRDFADFGVAQLLTASVSSVDIGVRKPHRGIFAAAAMAARTPVARCLMIGNSERNDVQGALALGMRTLRVAIDEPPPTASAAHAVSPSLAAAAAIVRAWLPRA